MIINTNLHFSIRSATILCAGGVENYLMCLVGTDQGDIFALPSRKYPTNESGETPWFSTLSKSLKKDLIAYAVHFEL